MAAALGAWQVRDKQGDLLEVFRLTGLMCLLAATAAGVQPIDSVLLLDDMDRMRGECRQSAEQGYTGWITIHPSQIGVVHEVCFPSDQEVVEVGNSSRHLRRIASWENGRFASKARWSMCRISSAPGDTRARTNRAANPPGSSNLTLREAVITGGRQASKCFGFATKGKSAIEFPLWSFGTEGASRRTLSIIRAAAG
jgi:hypothetical protein